MTAPSPGVLVPVRALFLRVRPDWRQLFFSITCLGASSLFEGLSVGLMIPVLEAMARGGGMVSNASIPALDKIMSFLPGLKFRYVLLLLLGLVVLSETLKHSLMYTSELIVSRLTRKMEHVLRVDIFNRYLQFSKAYFDRRKIGDLADLAINQVLLACDSLPALHSLLLFALFFTVHLTIMLLISWKLTLTSMVLLPAIYLVIRAISKRIQVSANRRFQIDQQMSSYMFDALQNVTLIRSYANEAAEGSAYRRISDDSRLNLHSIWKKIIFAPHAQEIIMAVTIVLLVCLSMLVLLEQRVSSIGIFLAFFIALRRFSANVTAIGSVWTHLSEKGAAVQRILALFDSGADVTIADGRREFEGLRDRIEFSKVIFDQSGSRLLDGVDVTFRKGKMTAIVGPTGAGKTTLANMIPRFYDATSGVIRVDGVPIQEFRLDSLRMRIAVVDQTIPLFNTTIRENILYGIRREVPAEELHEICRRACFHDFVAGLAEGYETRVGDRGIRLSGGERQRIAIARALLKDPSIFILDEATSSLDVETELSIQKALENITRGRTVIVIAHRLSTIRNADHIVVIEKGRVVEEGMFAELLERKGLFQRYWSLQAF